MNVQAMNKLKNEEKMSYPVKIIEKNGSPKPLFDTDDARSYFKTSFMIHPEFMGLELDSNQAWSQAGTKLGLSWD
jgi:hypothetical protein